MIEHCIKNIEKYIKEVVYKEELNILDYATIEACCRFVIKLKNHAWNGSYCKQFLHK